MLTLRHLGILIWLLPLLASAQAPFSATPPEDSLLRKCHAMPEDTSKVNCYNNLARSLLRSNPTKAQDIADNALSLGEELNFPSGKCRALNTIGAANQALGLLPEAMSSINQALTIANKTGDISSKASALLLLGGILREQQDSSAIVFMQQAFGIREQLHDTLGMVLCYNSMGAFYADYENHQRSLECYLRAATFCQHLRQDLILSIIYNNASSEFDLAGQPDSADLYFQRAIAIKQRFNDPKGMAYAYHSQALRLQNRDKYEESLTYDLKALEIFNQINHKPSIASCVMSVATSYMGLKTYPKALQYYQESLLLYQEMENQPSTISVYALLGKVYEAQGNFANASDMYSKSLVMANAMGGNGAIVTAAIGLGRTLIARKQYSQALLSLNQCLDLVKAGKITESDCYPVYEQLYLAYDALGNATLATEMRDTYERLRVENEPKE